MTLSSLLNRGLLTRAELPKNNYVGSLDKLQGYTVPLIDHDYGAMTPAMWNAVYEKLNLPVRNIMVVGSRQDAGEILDALRADPKYLGGGAGVGFKEAVVPYLDRVEPKDLSAVNIIVREGQELVGYNTDAEGLSLSVNDALKKANKTLEGSHVLVFGAGGVAKEFVRSLAHHKVKEVGIVNRTKSKAVDLAYELQKTGLETYAAGESLLRGTMLNTLNPPDAIINTTDKGSDGRLEKLSAFAPGDETYNNTLSIDNLRLLQKWNPNVVIVDIVLPKSGRSTTLRHADSAGLTNLVDGLPMVINQAGPAYKLVEGAHEKLHPESLGLEELLRVMRDATKN